MYGAYAMFHIDPVITSAALDRSEVCGKDQHVSLLRSEDHCLRLCAWGLLYEHKFSSGIILAWLVQEENQLHGEEYLSIQVLVKGVMTTCAILKDQHRGLVLTMCAALLVQIGEVRWEDTGIVQCFHPAVGNGSQSGIDGLTYGLYQGRQGIGEILVFTLAKAISFHGDGLSIQFLVLVAIDEPVTFDSIEDSWEQGIAIFIQADGGVFPIQCLYVCHAGKLGRATIVENPIIADAGAGKLCLQDPGSADGCLCRQD